MRISRTLHELLAQLDVVAVGEEPLGTVVVLEHAQTRRFGDLLDRDLFRTVVGDIVIL